MSEYYIYRYSPLGVKLDETKSFESLHLVRTVNKCGGLDLVLPMRYETTDFRNNQIIEVWRNGGLHAETAYFLKKWAFYEDADGKEHVQLYGYDANWLFLTRIVAYDEGSSEAEITDQACDIIQHVVRDNYGSDAITARQIDNWLSLEGFFNKGVTISKSISHRLVMDVCQEVADASTSEGTRVFFDVVRTGVGLFQVRSYINQRGVDHGFSSGDLRRVSKAEGNLRNPRLEIDYSGEANYIYAGNGTTVKEASDATRISRGYPWNRIETWVDAGGAGGDDEIQAEADAELERRAPKKVLTGQLVNTQAMQYDIHFGFGDVLGVNAFGDNFNCHASSIKIDVNKDNKEILTIALRGENASQ